MNTHVAAYEYIKYVLYAAQRQVPFWRMLCSSCELRTKNNFIRMWFVGFASCVCMCVCVYCGVYMNNIYLCIYLYGWNVANLNRVQKPSRKRDRESYSIQAKPFSFIYMSRVFLTYIYIYKKLVWVVHKFKFMQNCEWLSGEMFEKYTHLCKRERCVVNVEINVMIVRVRGKMCAIYFMYMRCK